MLIPHHMTAMPNGAGITPRVESERYGSEPQVPVAMRYVLDGQAKGKVVIII